MIGETSARVEDFAKRIGAEVYTESEDVARLSLGERAAANIDALAERMREGCTIYDLGIDSDRDVRGFFYFVETGLMEVSQYPHWVKIAQ